VDEDRAMARKEAELASERRKTARRHASELERLSVQVENAREAYEAARSKWRLSGRSGGRQWPSDRT
jgi:hypothetical protein